MKEMVQYNVKLHSVCDDDVMWYFWQLPPPDLNNNTPNFSQTKEEAAFKCVTLTSFVLNQLIFDFIADINKGGLQTGQNIPDKSPIPCQHISHTL